MPACSGRKCPSSFEEGGRFVSSPHRRHRRCNPLSVHRVTDSGLAYPRRAYSCFTYSCRACPAAAAACHSYSHLASPAAAAACHSYPHFAYFAVAAFGYRGTARTAPLPLGLKCRHGPRMFSYPARSAATARASFAVLPGAPHGPCSFSCSTERRTADPRPCSARGTKKRTEPHRGPSAAKKQPICRGSITAAALQPVRSVHAPETDPFRIVRAGISG